jgi:uncharacterized protein (TIGR02099 family)
MKRVRASVVNLFYAVVFLTAILKSLVFALTIYAENNINHVERWVSGFVGTQIHLDGIRASWSGLLPKIWLDNLSLGTDERLSLGDVRVSINSRSLPWWKTNPPLDIKLNGTHIHILREPSGIARVLGLSDGTSAFAPVLPAHIHIEDASILWEDRKRGGAELELEHVDVHLTSRDKEMHLVINAPQHKLLIRSDLQGNILGNDWSADTYLQTNEVEASPFANAYLPKEHTLDELKLGLESWSKWRGGRHVSTQAKLQLHRLVLRLAEGRRLTMDSAAANMKFRRGPDHWQLQFSDFSVDSSKGNWPTTDILLNLSVTEPGVQELRVGMSLIPLQVLNRLSGVFRPAGKLDTLLQQFSPTGELRKVRFHLQAGAAPEIRLQTFSADFSGISSKAWKKIPATSNLSGHIRGNLQQFQLDLDTRNASLIFPHLFRTPLPLSLVQGRLDWQSGAAGDWRLNSDRLIVESPDLQTVSRIAVNASPNEPLNLDLQTDFRNGIGANAGTYYPVGIMSPKLVEWLDRSIVSGSVPSGSFLLRGPLQGFPYHKTHTGHFEVLFDAENLVLDYQQGWPALKDGNARIQFYNNELHINASSAQILDSMVLQSNAHIPSLKPGSAIQIQGQANGPLSDALRLVRETSLQKKFSSAVEGMQASGNTGTKLKLTIPLSTTANYEFEGQLAMQDAGLTLTQHQLDLSRIRGQLNLDLNGINANGIRFKALGSDLQMDMNQSDHASTLINITGTLPIAEVQEQYPYLEFIAASGAAHTKIQLDLPNNRARGQIPASMSVSSDLKGISIDMPTPLNKSSGMLRPLILSLLLDSPDTDIRVHYADQARLHIMQNQAAEQRVTGSIEELPLGDWLEWYSQLESKAESADFNLHLLDLNVGHLSLGFFSASDLHLKVNREQQQWRGKLDSDRLKGNFKVPSDLANQPLVIRLDKLSMQLMEESAATQDHADPIPEDNLNPLDFPAVDFSCEELMRDDARLGKLRLKTHRTKDGMIIDDASINGRHVEAHLSGSWLNGGFGTVSRIKGEVNSRNMGRLLEKIYATTPVANSQTSLDIDLSWTGAPFQFHAANVKGGINLDVGEGRVLDLDPGAARMLGLLNIRTLSRRLQLDFSDMYKEGLSFDGILGSFILDNGNIYSNNLTIKSPSALIHISGSADLVHKQFDQLVTVSPKLDTTLPLAGAIVGGPATGLAVLLAQQVMSKPLSKLQRIEYSVHGPWHNTTITRIKRVKNQSGAEDILDL